jgi:hypothetical protein
MSIKSAIIKTNDVLAYFAFGAVLLIAVVMMFQGQVGAALAVAVGGWVVCSIVFGFWFALSEIAGNLRKIADKQ